MGVAFRPILLAICRRRPARSARSAGKRSGNKSAEMHFCALRCAAGHRVFISERIGEMSNKSAEVVEAAGALRIRISRKAVHEIYMATLNV